MVNRVLPPVFEVSSGKGEGSGFFEMFTCSGVCLVKRVSGLLFSKSRRGLERAEFSWDCCVCNHFQFQVAGCSRAHAGIYRRQIKTKEMNKK